MLLLSNSLSTLSKVTDKIQFIIYTSTDIQVLEVGPEHSTGNI